MQIDKLKPEQDLILSAKTDRFLEELQDHAADAGDTAALGSRHELSETFNNYARPKRNLKIALIIVFGLYVLGSTWLFMQGELWDNNYNYPEPPALDKLTAHSSFLEDVAGITLMSGIVFYMPVAVLVLLPSYFLHDVVGLSGSMSNAFDDGYFALAPFLATALWGGLATLILLPPKWLRDRFKRKQKV